MVNIPSKNKKVGLLGMGKSTVSAYKFLDKKGYSLFIWDDDQSIINRYKKLGFNIVSIEKWDYKNLDFIITSPGISLYYPIKHRVVELSSKYKTSILTDIEVFQYFFPNTKYIAITGTNGKSTMVSFIKYMLDVAGKKSYLAGNIGIPIFDLADEQNKNNIILELSSFQLSLIKQARFQIAGILNISNNHDKYHGGYANYLESKLKIFNNQRKSDIALLNIDDDYFNILNKKKLKAKKILISIKDDETADISIKKDMIINHNNLLIDVKGIKKDIKSNAFKLMVCFSLAIAQNLKIPYFIFIEALEKFKGLQHRQYFIKSYKNIKFINDSKATTPNAAADALSVYDNIYWLVGGIRKEGNLDICKPFYKKIKKAFIFGKDKGSFEQELKGNVDFLTFNSLELAFTKSFKLAIKDKENIVILLSPIGVSFDEFSNFEERGNYFIKLVEEVTNVI